MNRVGASRLYKVSVCCPSLNRSGRPKGKHLPPTSPLCFKKKSQCFSLQSQQCGEFGAFSCLFSLKAHCFLFFIFGFIGTSGNVFSFKSQRGGGVGGVFSLFLTQTQRNNSYCGLSRTRSVDIHKVKLPN